MASIDQLERKVLELERRLNVEAEEANRLMAKSNKVLEIAKNAYKLDGYGYVWQYDPNKEEYYKTNMRVMTPEIADRAVMARHIADGAVTGDKFENGAVILGKIANDAVATRNIKNEAVTPEKLSPEVLMSLLYDIGVDADGTLWVILGNPKGVDIPDEDWQRMSFHDYHERRVMVARDLEDEVCPVELQESGECTVIYENAGDEEYTVSISPRYKTAEGENVTLTVPVGGYAEVSYLKSGGVVYVRGV